MTWLRLLNIARTVRLERELSALSAEHESMRADVVNYYDITSRQLDPRSDAALLARAFKSENERGVTRMVVKRALDDLRRGRHDMAVADLEALLGEAHAEPEPIHLLDVVA